MIKHSEKAISAHPAPDRDGIVSHQQRGTNRIISRKSFKDGKSYADACRFTFLMRSAYDAWSFMGLKV
jgi:hypothetical protein